MMYNTQKRPTCNLRTMQALSACTFAQADIGRGCSLTESMDTVEYVDKERMSRANCTDAHTHLDHCCSHTENAFPMLSINVFLEKEEKYYLQLWY